MRIILNAVNGVLGYLSLTGFKLIRALTVKIILKNECHRFVYMCTCFPYLV